MILRYVNLWAPSMRKSEFGISRSRLGRLNVQFDGGPYYPSMLETLKQMVVQHGRLIRRGENISGSMWLQRIEQSGAGISRLEIEAVQTLME